MSNDGSPLVQYKGLWNMHHKLSKIFHVLSGPCRITCPNSHVSFVPFTSQTFQKFPCTMRSFLYYLFKLQCIVCFVQFTNVPKSSMYYQVLVVLLVQTPMHDLFRSVHKRSKIFYVLSGPCTTSSTSNVLFVPAS